MASVAFPLDDAPTVIKTFCRDARRFLKQSSPIPPSTQPTPRVQAATPIGNVADLLEFIEHLLLTQGDVGRLKTALGTLTREELEQNGFPIAAANLLKELIGILLTLAKKGSVSAGEELLESALLGCHAVGDLATRHPKLFKRSAPRCSRWPVAWTESGWSDKGPEKMKLVALLKRLRFGSSHPQKQKGKSSNAPAPGRNSGKKFAQKHRHILAAYAHRMMAVLTPANRDVTFRVHVELRRTSVPGWLYTAAQLPAFDKHKREVVMQWFEVGYEALSDAAKGRIESLPGLEDVGKSARHAFAGEDEALDGQSEHEALKRERNGCKNRLRDAFLTRFFESEKG